MESQPTDPDLLIHSPTHPLPPHIRLGGSKTAATARSFPSLGEQCLGGATSPSTRAAAPRSSPRRTRPSSSRHCFLPRTDPAPARTGIRRRRPKSDDAQRLKAPLPPPTPLYPSLRRGRSLALPPKFSETKASIPRWGGNCGSLGPTNGKVPLRLSNQEHLFHKSLRRFGKVRQKKKKKKCEVPKKATVNPAG